MPLQLGSDEENGRGVFRGPLMLKAKSSENWSNFDLLGAMEIRGNEKKRFYCKRHILAWIHVVWAI